MTKIRRRRVLRSYQEQMISYLCCRQHGALFVEMRLGKTIVMIRRIRMLSDIKRILVVAPYSAFESWRVELRLEHEKPPIEIIGTWYKRHQLMYDFSSRWYLINKEGHRTIPEITKCGWDIIILDESTFIKSPKTQASKFFIKNFRNVKHRFILTGSPAPESELDYYQQLAFLDSRYLGYKNYWEFRYNLFDEVFHKFHLTQQGRKFLQEQLSNHCYFLKREQVDLGGQKIHVRRMIKMNKKIADIYYTLKNDFILEINGKQITSTLFAISAFTLMRRLFGGFADDKLISRAKIDEILLLLAGELKGEQLVIWCVFLQEIDMLHEILSSKYKCATISGRVGIPKRDPILRSFQKKEIQILIAQPECFKHGTDLSAADIMIYYSTPLGAETRLQSEDRIISAESTSSLIIDLCVEDTIEEDILEGIIMKEIKQEIMQRVIRKLLRGS